MKRKILVASCSVILLILGAGGCSSLRDRVDSMVVVTDWPSSSAWRVAVLDCETPGTKERIENGLTVTSIAGSGVKMADAVAELLGREDDYLVVDRALMLRTLQEHSLPTTGIPPSNKLAEMGRVLNADALVLGRCEGWHWGNQHEWGERFNASLWLIMTANGQAAWSAEGKAVLVGSRSDIIQLLAGDMVGKLVAGSGKAEPPPGLSSGPYPVAGESKITPVPPPPLAQASPPPPAPVAEKEMDDM
ncbi:MAG TPA: hypothetical protein ENH12_06645, partial [Proteobacteria bacterium]|nr:hypothetical protein [Pseudomonadota bacterium]